jgi:hypothetical protein
MAMGRYVFSDEGDVVTGPMRGYYLRHDNWGARLGGRVLFHFSDERGTEALWCYSQAGNWRNCFENPKDAYAFASQFGESAYFQNDFDSLKRHHKASITIIDRCMPFISGAKQGIFETLSEDFQLEDMAMGAAIVGGAVIVGVTATTLAPASGTIATILGGITAIGKGASYALGGYAILQPLTEVQDIDLNSSDDTKRGFTKVFAKSATRAAEDILLSRLFSAAGRKLKRAGALMAERASALWKKFKIRKPRFGAPDLGKGNAFSAQKAIEIRKFRFFQSDEAVEHFNKHAEEIMGLMNKDIYTLKDYVDDANHVINHGIYVPELNAYVKLIGGTRKAKYAFVGLDRATGNIKTLHIKKIDWLMKKAPSLGLEK